MRTRNLSFQLEETALGAFLLQGWLGGILAGFVYTVATCVFYRTKFFDAIVVLVSFFIFGSVLGVIKAILMWAPFRLFKIQVRAATRVTITSIATGLFAFATGFLSSRDASNWCPWVVTLVLGELPTAILVGSSIKPWKIFTFGSINVGIGRSESRSVLGTLGTLPLRFLSLLGLAAWVLYVVCEYKNAWGWSIDFILWLLVPTAYLLFSAYVTFRSPYKLILFITGLAANIPVALTALYAYAIYSHWSRTDSLYVAVIFSAFVIAWVVFLVARLSVGTNNVVIPGSILSSPSLPRANRRLDHQCLGSRFMEWQERHA